MSNDLTERFEGHVLEVDGRVADAWGRIMARSQRAGHTLGSMDAIFAATAESHALTLVTRNARDFDALGIPVLNLWERGQES